MQSGTSRVSFQLELWGGDLEPPLCLESDEVNLKLQPMSSAMNGTVDGVLKDFLQTTSTRLPFTSPIEKRLLGWKKGEFKNEQDEVKAQHVIMF